MGKGHWLGERFVTILYLLMFHAQKRLSISAFAADSRCPSSPKAVGLGVFSLNLPGILFEGDHLSLTTQSNPASLQEERRAVYLTS